MTVIVIFSSILIEVVTGMITINHAEAIPDVDVLITSITDNSLLTRTKTLHNHLITKLAINCPISLTSQALLPGMVLHLNLIETIHRIFTMPEKDAHATVPL